MSVNTHNTYGKISISDKAIAKVALKATLDCYGIVETVSNKFSDSISEFLKFDTTKGVKVSTLDDRIYIDLFVMIKFGVSISAVAESLKQTVKYAVENFTGMIVDTVNVNIVGVKL
ncbi:MAG: Asp23/Gls24 family envelope stress response protein [Clostridia bacterium]|nr:Asp23/Gls24 family envelope stress response protein [Clostridia bacterium]MBQ9480599.1 Asp23/Gls24 family envelope stress response protein [Clostridia bacterium]